MVLEKKETKTQHINQQIHELISVTMQNRRQGISNLLKHTE